MSMMEEYLELQDKFEKMKKDYDSIVNKLSDKDSKLIELSDKVNELTNSAVRGQSDSEKYKSMTSLLKEDKKELESERSRLIKEVERLTRDVERFSKMMETNQKTLEAKEEMLLSKEQQLVTKDKSIIEKDARVDELTNKLGATTDENLEMSKKLGELEKNNDKFKTQLTDLKSKNKQMRRDLLSKEMALEKKKKGADKPQEGSPVDAEVIKKIEEAHAKEVGDMKAEIEKLKADVETASAEETTSDEVVEHKGISLYDNIDQLITDFKKKLIKVNRTVRIIIPSITDAEKYKMTDLLCNLPRNILKNMACAADVSGDSSLITKFQNNKFKLTNYTSNLFALAIDNDEVAIAVLDETDSKTLTGIACSNKNLNKLFTQALMNPFIKGTKIN